jgi:DNA-binding NarL/FixJ family response regulator
MSKDEVFELVHKDTGTPFRTMHGAITIIKPEGGSQMVEEAEIEFTCEEFNGATVKQKDRAERNREIVAMRRSGVSNKYIAQRFGLSRVYVSMILRQFGLTKGGRA